MKLMINHQTYYQYTAPARNSIQYIKMMPQSNRHQQVQHWNISVPGANSCQKDRFDNLWMTTTQRFEYVDLMIMAQGVVEIDQHNLFGIETMLDPMHFLQVTPFTLCTWEMLQFAQHHVKQVDVEHLQILAAAILAEMPYIPASTTVMHSASESFAAKQGVCQDHSHVFIAMVKALGVPARYVSGYLFANDQAHLASHAWAEAFIEGKWYCFDVSNQIFQPSSHIYIATGRDYWDVAPVRGVRSQGGIESMQSIVQVLACA